MSKYTSKEKWKYLWYTMSHPMDGFYWIRHQERGSVLLAVLLFASTSDSHTIRNLTESFVVNDVDPRSVDVLTELMGVFLFYLLVCAGNWAVTCLMNGEGRFKDILIAVGYSTVPMSAGIALATIMSWFVADTEQAFYGIVLAVGIAYGIIMMLIGIMQVHNYTIGKTLITLFLTFIVVLVIVFLALLLSNLISMVLVFIKSVYTEIVFRS